MQRTEGTGTGYAKNGITCARSLTLAKKRSAAPDQGVRPDGMPLRRGKSIMLTHEDTLTRIKAYPLTRGYIALTRAFYFAHAGNLMLTQKTAYRSRGKKLSVTRETAYPLTWGKSISVHTGKQHIALTRTKAYAAHAGKNND